MKGWKETTRAVLPVLGVGREPLLIETDTEAPMVVIDYDRKEIAVIPEFKEHPHVVLFQLSHLNLPTHLVIREWRQILRTARSTGLLKDDRSDIG